LIRSFEEKFADDVVVVGSGEERTRDETAIDDGGINAAGDDKA
jgi:hypothetical protein